MKTFGIGIAILVIAIIGGYFFLQNNSTSKSSQQSYQTASITRTGLLQKSNGADFKHSIISAGQSWGVTSQSINLDQYVGKKVEATGQNSGTTLYIDTITIVQ
jgi:hypothetical protein